MKENLWTLDANAMVKVKEGSVVSPSSGIALVSVGLFTASLIVCYLPGDILLLQFSFSVLISGIVVCLSFCVIFILHQL